MSKKILTIVLFSISSSIISLSAPEYSTSRAGLKNIDNFIDDLISYENYYEGFEDKNNVHVYCLKGGFSEGRCASLNYSDRRNYFIGKIIEKNAYSSLLAVAASENTLKFRSTVVDIIKALEESFKTGGVEQKKLFRDLKRTLNKNKRKVSDAFENELNALEKYVFSFVSIEVNSNIKGSKVFLDGRYLGKTPLKTEKIYPPNKHTLKLNKSFLTKKVKINLSKKTSFSIDLKSSKGDLVVISKLENELRDKTRKIEDDISFDNLKNLINAKQKSRNFIKEFKSLELDNEEGKLQNLKLLINDYNKEKILNISEKILSSEDNLDSLIQNYNQLAKIDSNFKEKNLIKLYLSGQGTNEINNDIKALEVTENEINLETLRDGFFISIFSNPKKIERNVISQNEKIGQYLSGTRQIPNGKYVIAKNNHDIAYNNYIIAKNRADTASRACYQQGSFLEQLLCGGIISALASSSEAVAYEEAKNILQRTPPYIDENIYSEYVYGETIVKAKKSQTVNVTQLNIDKLEQEKGQISFEKTDTFYIYTGLHPDEENPPKQQDTQEKLDNFLTQPVSNLKLSKIISKFQVLKEKNSANFSSLNEVSIIKNKTLAKNESGFFNKIFSFFWNQNSDDRELEAKEENELEIDKRFESVVQIKTLSGSGTGFYINDNLIVTNEHVVENNATVDVINFYKDKFVGEVIKVDRYRDLALISVSKKGFPAKIYRRSFLKLGSEVEALGHPIGFDYSLSRGIVSSTRKISPPFASVNLGEVEYIQTDTDINPGNSGGPLFYDNEVIGMNAWKQSYDTQNRPVSGINFAISYKELINFLE
tara:strand:+ start:159 stop:2624 length:2466 start_codon:yes stop_codon:yes gene_type:complete